MRFTGYVPDADLPALYAGADALAFASRDEGFGMPALEAMASTAIGTPRKPVTRSAVVNTPATTVSGATDEATDMPMPATPIRSRASAADTALSSNDVLEVRGTWLLPFRHCGMTGVGGWPVLSSHDGLADDLLGAPQ